MTTNEESEKTFQRACAEYDREEFSTARVHLLTLYHAGFEELSYDIANTYFLSGEYSSAMSWFGKVKSGNNWVQATLRTAAMLYDGKGGNSR